MLLKEDIINKIMLEGQSYKQIRPKEVDNVPTLDDGELTLWHVDIYPGTLVCKVNRSDRYGSMYRISIPIDKDATIMSNREIGKYISIFLDEKNKETEVNWY